MKITYTNTGIVSFFTKYSLMRVQAYNPTLLASALKAVNIILVIAFHQCGVDANKSYRAQLKCFPLFHKDQRYYLKKFSTVNIMLH